MSKKGSTRPHTTSAPSHSKPKTPKNKSEKHKKSKKSSGGDDLEDVNITFETYNMSSGDYHAVRQFLSNALPPTLSTSAKSSNEKKSKHAGTANLSNCSFNVVGMLAGAVTDQLADYIGTTVKQAEEGEAGDAFGFVSLVPLGSNSKEAFPEYKQLISSLETFINNKKEIQESIFNFDGAAVLLNERMINLPHDIAQPLYQQFLDDLKNAGRANRNENAQERARTQLFASIDTFILLLPMYEEVTPSTTITDEDEDDADNLNVSSEKGSQSNQQYYYPEFEYLDDLVGNENNNNADSLFVYTVPSSHSTTDSRRVFTQKGSRPYRRVLMVSKAVFEKFVLGVPAPSTSASKS